MTPGDGRDPAWIRLADRCYGAGLSFFSSSHRREYGDLMRQAFRDRCREVARGERSAWHTFVLELTPDLVSNIGRENMNSIFGDMRPRQVMLLALLSLSSGYFLFGEAMGLRLSDLAVTLSQAANRIGREREAEALRTRLHRVAEPLAAGSTHQSKALAALMYRLTDLTTGWISPNEDDSPDSATANALTRTVLAGPTDAHLLALSARLCMPMRGCDLEGITRRMLQLTPDNGYAWALEYKLGLLAKNPVRMRRALAGLASARYYDAHEGHVASDVLKEVVRLAPNDARTLDTVAGVLAGGWQSVMLGAFCGPADASIPRFGLTAEQIESARGDCISAGRLMAASTQLDTALRGEKIVQALSNSPAERAAALAHGRELEWLGRQLRLVDEKHDWMYSYRPRVDMLLATFRAGEGEIPSARRWVSEQGIPAFRPD